MELTNWCVDNNKNKHSLIKKLEVWSLSITFINILIYKIYALKVVMPCIFYESNDKWVWLRLNLNTCLKFPRSCIKALDGCFAYEKWVIGFGVKFWIQYMSHVQYIIFFNKFKTRDCIEFDYSWKIKNWLYLIGQYNHVFEFNWET